MLCDFRLAVLMQRAEVYLPKKLSKKNPVAPSPAPSTKPKKTPTRIKALSPKMQKDETLEVRCFVRYD